MPLNWPPKDPDEILDYVVDWTAPLAGDSITASNYIVVSGVITINSQSFTANTAKVWLAGGVAGTVVTLQNRISTLAARTFEDTIYLPIRSSDVVASPVASYTVPAVAQFQARFPTFAAVEEQAISRAIEEAGRYVDSSWTIGDYALGIMLYAAHVLTMDGYGTGAEAQAAAAGASGFKVMRSGSLTLDRGDVAAGSKSDVLGLNATSYGKRFRTLLRVNRGGPRVLRSTSPYPAGCASDWPPYL